MNETRTLARFVAETKFTDLPRGLVDNCKIAVLDAFGAGFVGSVQPWAQRIVSVVRTLGGKPEASVIHQDWRTDVSRAALANGVLIGSFECEPLTGSHASGTVLPAALAVCQLGRAGLLLGRLDEARRLGDRVIEFSPRRPGFAAHALHLLGDIATHPERFDAEIGEAYYRKALGLAEPRGMRPLVAHCHFGLAKLYRRTGKQQQAQEHLATATTMYREMDMRFYLEQAEAVAKQPE